MSEPDPPTTDDRPRSVLPSIAWARLMKAIAGIGILVVVTSIGLGVAAVAAAGVYAQYGAVKNAPDTEAWAGLTARFAEPATCTRCHAPEASAQDASAHVNVSCETCHGAGVAHSASDAAARLAVLVTPASGACVTCHGATAGRPATFAQVDPTTHFSGGACLRCHDAHSIVAAVPPIVSHPLENLPACTTCHAPDGLKQIPTGHEIVRDAICLTCHGRYARGSSEWRP